MNPVELGPMLPTKPLPELRTERLLLRAWRDSDSEPFAALNADPRVMEHYPSTLSRAESDATIERIVAHFHNHGFGPWAVEVPQRAAFIGFIGIHFTPFSAHFTPCIEVGWRLSPDHWNHGYATEGARAALAFGLGALGLPEIVAMTVPANQRSRRVMEKLGMTHNPADDFDHPWMRPEDPHCRHVLYRLHNPAAVGTAPRRP